MDKARPMLRANVVTPRKPKPVHTPSYRPIPTPTTQAEWRRRLRKENRQEHDALTTGHNRQVNAERGINPKSFYRASVIKQLSLTLAA